MKLNTMFLSECCGDRQVIGCYTKLNPLVGFVLQPITQLGMNEKHCIEF